MATDKNILNKGIKILSWALPCCFIGPTVIHFAFINQLQPLYPVVLGVGILIAFTGIFLIFKGIITIINSMS
ncbi:DUF6095 family protein [Flavobacterium sp. 3HN19-14]|uniref:DUF6095 family protein n=1 Tax=Flavobacterium sp. 3HN19-14 TaxID=3448133 RepID=UPI003EE35CBD